jgi:hypothetical protein
MLELDGIVKVRRPDNARWNDGATYRFGVRLVDPEAGLEFYEDASIEDLQSYTRFQCFVAREFGHWYRYVLAENPATGQMAWSEYLASVWDRQRAGAGDEPDPLYDAAPWVQDEGA